MTPSPFKSTPSGEALSDIITEKSPVDLVLSLISLALCFGMDRTEAAIRAAYPNTSAAHIITGMHTAIQAHMENVRRDVA